jgi:UDP-glucose 4-epimerase
LSWLLTGASGYIGQHVTDVFTKNGQKILALDLHDFDVRSPHYEGIEMFKCDISNLNSLMKVFEEKEIKGIINLAALKSVEESMKYPEKYNLINTNAVKNLIYCAKLFKVEYFIQSSTAAVYGETQSGLVTELTPAIPVSPYGSSKLQAELELARAIQNGNLKGISLRYFNVLGSSRIEFQDKSESNVVPLVLNAIKSNMSPKIFGGDYLTPDGTAIRDYIHVQDLAEAHYLAAMKLTDSYMPQILNLGSGKGYSVLEVVTELLNQTGSSLAPEILDRRPGDVAKLVADIDLARKSIAFNPRYTLRDMIESSI